MEALTNSIRLRALGLGTAVIDVLDGEVELVLAALVENARNISYIPDTR